MLKGKTIIELKDVNTGKVERFEDENIVTNAVQHYLTAMLTIAGARSANDKYMPVYNNALGGVKLFENTITEDAANYIIPSVGDNKVVGYASSKVKSNDDAKRGTFNLNESTLLENGVQLVFDFATSEANGTIACVCLASNGSCDRSYKCGITSLTDTSQSPMNLLLEYFNYVLGYDKTNDCFYIYKDSKILKCRFRPDSLMLDKYFLEPETIEDLGTITYKDSVMSELKLLNPTTLYYAPYLTTSNSGTMSVFYYNLRTGEKIQTIDFDSTGMIVKSSFGIIANGYLFYPKNDSSGIYKINLSNTSDITVIEISGGTLSSKMFLLSNGDIMCGNVILDPDSGTYDINFVQDEDSYVPSILYNGYAVSTINNTKYFGTNELMLMTINNLDTPVTKTADKTMKITYTLTYTN